MSEPRRANNVIQERDRVEASTVAATAATASVALGVVDRDYAVEAFRVEMPGGYVADDVNRYTITLQAGAKVLATLDLTTATGNLTDLVFASAPLAADPSGTAGDTLKAVLTKNGTAANVPAGTRLVAHLTLL